MHIPSHSRRPCSYDSLTVSFCIRRGLRSHKYTKKEREKKEKNGMCVCHVLYRIPSPYLYFKHPVNGPKYVYILYLGSVSPIIGYVYRFPVGPSSNGWFANGKMNIILDKSSLFVGHSTQAMFFVPSSPAGTKSHSVMQLGIWPIKG